jgi:hypothetical protein
VIPDSRLNAALREVPMTRIIIVDHPETMPPPIECCGLKVAGC